MLWSPWFQVQGLKNIFFFSALRDQSVLASRYIIRFSFHTPVALRGAVLFSVMGGVLNALCQAVSRLQSVCVCVFKAWPDLAQFISPSGFCGLNFPSSYQFEQITTS